MSTSGRMEQVVKAEHLGLDSLGGGMALNMQIAGPSSRILTRPTNQSLHFQAHLTLFSPNQPCSRSLVYPGLNCDASSHRHPFVEVFNPLL